MQKLCIVIHVFIEKIFYFETKYTTLKMEYFPFLPLFDKIGGRTATTIARPKDIFAAPFELFCRIFGHLATVRGLYLLIVLPRQRGNLHVVSTRHLDSNQVLVHE